jgi:acyl-CoA synthetase (AMP-forming)/AMP-acid ligase II
VSNAVRQNPRDEANVNVADIVLKRARDLGDRTALVVPRPGGADGHAEVISFRGLAERIDELAAGLAREGLRPGDRMLLVAPVSVDFYALAIAALALGGTVILLDGALGARRALVALRAARPRFVVGARAAVRLWPLLPPTWRARRFTSDAACVGARPLEGLAVHAPPACVPVERHEDDEALLTFTSGSSGRPKGADRTHGILVAQHEALVHEMPHADDDADMTCFPAVALHNLCCGITTVLPPIDLRHPAGADGARVVRAVERWGVTRLSGAPAFHERLVEALERSESRLPRLRAVAIGGAPVRRSLAARMIARYPAARAMALYGSTEAEPIASATLAEVVEADGEGYLAGHAAPAAEVERVQLPDSPPRLDARGLAPFRAGDDRDGEVVVRGAHVNRHYVGDDASNRALKLRDPRGGVWHRTGDLARRDARGRLWLTGRTPDVVTHAGRSVAPFVVEAAVDELPGVRASALVSHARAPEGELFVVARDAGGVSRARGWLDSHGMHRVPLHAVASLPVDARHESKIDRARLRAERGQR